MFKEIKLPFSMSVLEFFTIVTFVAIGYSILYKYAFYSELNITWYLYSLQPNYILFSSVKLIFFILLGFLAGSAILKPISNNLKIAIIFTILYISSVIIIFFTPHQWLEEFGRFNVAIIIMGLSIAILVKILLLFLKLESVNQNLKYYTVLILIALLIFLILYIPSRFGMKDAKDLMDINSNLNVVKLKEQNDKWILVELDGDKALIMNKNEKNTFKIVEYKDIDKIITK